LLRKEKDSAYLISIVGSVPFQKIKPEFNEKLLVIQITFVLFETLELPHFIKITHTL